MTDNVAPVQHRLPVSRPATSWAAKRTDQAAEWFAAWRTEHYRGAWHVSPETCLDQHKLIE